MNTKYKISRRNFLKIAGASTILAGCSNKSKINYSKLTTHENSLFSFNPSTLKIIQWKLNGKNPNSLLRKTAKNAKSLKKSDLKKIETLMRNTLKKSGGVGLAAPQVDISRKIILVQLQNEKKEMLLCIDPVIIKINKINIGGYEGCLSVKGVGGYVMRSTKLTISYFDMEMKKHILDSQDFEARIFQHEMDHLKGVLYIDKIVGDLLPYEKIKEIRKKAKEKHASTANYSFKESILL
jgi:peptide deformylase